MATDATNVQLIASPVQERVEEKTKESVRRAQGTSRRAQGTPRKKALSLDRR